MKFLAFQPFFKGEYFIGWFDLKPAVSLPLGYENNCRRNQDGGRDGGKFLQFLVQ
jgi:hypothetical protein